PLARQPGALGEGDRHPLRGRRDLRGAAARRASRQRHPRLSRDDEATAGVPGDGRPRRPRAELRPRAPRRARRRLPRLARRRLIVDPRVRGFLSDEERAVRRPIDPARTLPRSAYAGEDFFAWELEKVALGNWASIAFEDEIAGAGDPQPLEAFGLPLLLVRDRRKILRVFHNVSPYDGCRVLLRPCTRLPAPPRPALRA